MAEPFEPLVIWDLEDDPDGNYEFPRTRFGMWSATPKTKRCQVIQPAGLRPSDGRRPAGISWWFGSISRMIHARSNP